MHMPELVPPASAWLRHIVFTALILTSAAPAAAQKFDTTYVEEIPTRYRINTGLRYDDNSATFSTLDGREFRLENRRLAFRIGGRYGIPSYTFSIPLSDLGTGTDEENGDSWGLGIRLFRRYGYLRSQFRFTDGFRLTQPDGQSVFRDDIKLFTAFVYAYHLLNGRRYSLRSSFNQRDRQRVSQGSFLVGGLGTRKRLLADGLLLPQSKAGDLNLMRFAQTTLGVGGGYAYTKVIRDNFFITPFLYGGPEVQVANVQQVEERRKAQAVKLGFQYRARLSIGYHGGNKFAALIGDFIPSRDQSVNLRTREEQTQVTLRLGVQW